MTTRIYISWQAFWGWICGMATYATIGNVEEGNYIGLFATSALVALAAYHALFPPKDSR